MEAVSNVIMLCSWVLSPGQTDSQVDPRFQLASTWESVWPGLYPESANLLPGASMGIACEQAPSEGGKKSFGGGKNNPASEASS